MNWNEIVNDVPKLSHGSHENFGPELCFMEMTAFIAGEPHSDNPECASPVLTAYGIGLNDAGQQFRDVLTPIVPQMIGTRNDELEPERLEYLIFNVARRILPIVLKEVVDPALVEAIVKASTYADLESAADAAAHAAHAGYADGAAYAAARAAYAAAHAGYADGAGYAADAAYAAAHAAGAAIPQIAADILLEAIRLDSDKKPVEVDLSRVQVLREMVQP
jgi:hypothetical protein